MKMSDNNRFNGFGGNFSEFLHDFRNDIAAFCCVHNDNPITSFEHSFPIERRITVF